MGSKEMEEKERETADLGQRAETIFHWLVVVVVVVVVGGGGGEREGEEAIWGYKQGVEG
jgi:hypothetical protein